MPDFYAVIAQVTPVLLIALVFQTPANKGDAGWKRARVFVYFAGAVELSAVLGVFLWAIPRQSWMPAWLPWLGAGIVLAGFMIILARAVHAMATEEMIKKWRQVREDFHLIAEKVKRPSD